MPADDERDGHIFWPADGPSLRVTLQGRAFLFLMLYSPRFPKAVLRRIAGGWPRGRAAVSGDQESFGIFLGDGEEFEGGLARAARALFPAADSVGAYVQVAGEERLARVKRMADLADFF